ncbi:alpha/beta hydrolase [Prescottella defluvii]|nr:alpha/beta hydrolase [Prescottella defluvii]
MSAPTIVIVPGLADPTPGHWQNLLTEQLQPVRVVPPLQHDRLSCTAQVEALNRVIAEIPGPIVLVAHSAGVLTTVHWAHRHRGPVVGALLATPPDFDSRLPAGYPTPEALTRNGWTPIPTEPLPFPSIVAVSANDALASADRVHALAQRWGSRTVDLGAVGHLNPSSGFGYWPLAEQLVSALVHEAAGTS